MTLAGIIFSKGCPSVWWKDVQHQYYEWLQRRNTGKAWLQALIKKVWEVSWDMWEDHRKEVRTTTITPAMMRETENLNEQIIEEFEEGEAGLVQKITTCWLSRSLTSLGMTWTTNPNVWNQLRWLECGLQIGMKLKPPPFSTSVSSWLPGCAMGRASLSPVSSAAAVGSRSVVCIWESLRSESHDWHCGIPGALLVALQTLTGCVSLLRTQRATEVTSPLGTRLDNLGWPPSPRPRQAH
jgi:hypothetical protein